MNLTMRQKILLAVFAIGLIGLVADGTILRPQGGPQAASADSAPIAPVVAPLPGQAPTVEDAPAPMTLAQRLERLDPGPTLDPNELRDPFALPLAWSDTDPHLGKAPATVREFVRRHQLKAVLLRGREALALVDDRFLAPGGHLDGFELVQVSDRCAIFERDGRQAILSLAEQETSGKPQPGGAAPSK